MITVSCPTCFIEHGIPEGMYQRAQEQKDRQKIYCPNGHQWWYTGESEATKQRRRAEQAEQANARLQEEARRAIVQRNAAQADLKRHKHRTAAGVCPCCSRSFIKLAQHIKTKHPDYNVVKLKAGPERLP